MTAENLPYDKQYLSELDRWCPRHPPAASDAGAPGPDPAPWPGHQSHNNDSRQVPTGGRPDPDERTVMDQLEKLSEEQLLDLLEAVLAEKSRRRARRVLLEGLR